MYKLIPREEWFKRAEGRTDRLAEGMIELKRRLDLIEPQPEKKDLERKIKGVGEIRCAFDGAPYVEESKVYVPGEGMCPKIYIGDIVEE